MNRRFFANGVELEPCPQEDRVLNPLIYITVSFDLFQTLSLDDEVSITYLGKTIMGRLEEKTFDGLYGKHEIGIRPYE